MAFNHTEYAHRTGRRSRPRDPEQMMSVLIALDQAIGESREARGRHAHRDLPGRTRDLRVAQAKLETAMIPARQEAARNGKDRNRRRVWGDPLKQRTAAARYERLRLKKMIGDWK